MSKRNDIRGRAEADKNHGRMGGVYIENLHVEASDLAEALRSINPDPQHPSQDANDTFERLRALLTSKATPTPHQPSPGGLPQGRATNLPSAFPQPQPQFFNPIGQFHVMCANGSQAFTQHIPNGMMSGMVQHPFFGQGQIVGAWRYDPAMRLLYTQGLVNGMMPFQGALLIQAVQGNTATAIGYDGLMYTLHRMG